MITYDILGVKVYKTQSFVDIGDLLNYIGLKIFQSLQDVVHFH